MANLYCTDGTILAKHFKNLMIKNNNKYGVTR